MDDINGFELPVVELIAFTRGDDEKLGPQEISAIGALGCFREDSSGKIWYKIKEMEDEKLDNLVKNVLKESAGRGHGSVTDQNLFIYSIEDAPRSATLFLCGPEYLSHEQQSLRRASPTKGYYLPEKILKSKLAERVIQVLDDSFEFYDKAVESGVPKEDARNPLSLYTRTNIQTAGNARELMHLKKMSDGDSVPSVVKYTIGEIIKKAEEVAPNIFEDTGYNYETLAWRPSSQFFAPENRTINRMIEKNETPEKPVILSYSGIEMGEEEIDDAVKNRNEAELANLKHIHFEFISPMSISCFHQATRQRTWNQSVESIYDAAERGKMSVPPKIKNSVVFEDYQKQNDEMLRLYNDLLEEGIPRSEAVGVLPHSLEIYDLMHVDGWNAVHSIGKRTCTEAQWEIRNIAREMSKHIKEKNSPLGKYSEPQCIVYGKCPEREPCGYFEKVSE